MKRHVLVMSGTALVALAVLLAQGRALGQQPATDPSEDPAPSTHDRAARIFDKFNHKRHEGILGERGIGCPSCHQVGSKGDARISSDTLSSWLSPPPPKACHFCHNPSDGSEPVGAGRCVMCHETIEPPTSHGAGWVQVHGTEARLETWSCDNCHRRSFCVDCHERKEAARYKVHDRAWLTVHGVAVQADPAACSTCHLQADCQSCHQSIDGRLR